MIDVVWFLILTAANRVNWWLMASDWDRPYRRSIHERSASDMRRTRRAGAEAGISGSVV